MRVSYETLCDAARAAATCQGTVSPGTLRKRQRSTDKWLSSLATKTEQRSTFAQIWAYLAYMRSRMAILTRITLMQGEQRALDLIVGLSFSHMDDPATFTKLSHVQPTMSQVKTLTVPTVSPSIL